MEEHQSTDIVARLREDAEIMRAKPGFPTISDELGEAADEIERLRNIIRRRLACDGSEGRYHAGEHLTLTEEMRSAVSQPNGASTSSKCPG